MNIEKKPTQIMGYSDRLSARQGEELDFYISSPKGEFEARVWKVQSIDGRDGAPGVKTERVQSTLDKKYAGREQTSAIGSFMSFEDHRGMLLEQATTIVFSFLPTAVDRSIPQTLLSFGHEENFQLRLLNGRVELVDGGRVIATLQCRIFNHYWYRIILACNGENVTLRLTGSSQMSYGMLHPQIAMSSKPVRLARGTGQRVTVAAHEAGAVKHHFTGKIGELCFASCCPEQAEIEAIESGQYAREILGTNVWASWSFGRDPAQFQVPSTVPGGPTAVLHNLPMRAVTGPSWSGRYHHYLLAEREYDALLFHADMVGGGDWERTLTLPVEPSWDSGIYALEVTDGKDSDWIPFYVRPKHQGEKASVAFLAPTNTYLAYGNETNSMSEIGVAELSLMKNEVVQAQAADRYVADHPELGLSIYDNHLDGAGVAYASRLRPLLNFRPFHRNWLNSSYRHFAADFYLIDWLAENGFAFDVLTDEDLHMEGRRALDDYSVILTGSHPEYVSERMIDALQDYVSDGGNLMYLGGNGFYWTTSFHPDRPDLIEVRRGLTGARNWTSPPGEIVHAFSGEQGGIWRTKGRSPHRLTGIGMGAVGWGRASPYKLSEDARTGEHSWVFEGVEGEIVGTEGMMLNGAAGDEVDHTDALHGTPANVKVLASSIDHSDYFQPVIEDYTNILPNQGGSKNPLVRADMTWLDVPNGGSIFSVGSICWIGCLPHNNYKNSVSQITANVLGRLSRKITDAS